MIQRHRLRAVPFPFDLDMNDSRPGWISWVLLLALAGALVLVGRVEFRRTAAAAAVEPTYVPSSAAVRTLGSGTKLTIANYYWLLCVQYMGDQALRRGDYAKLHPIADFVTDLDPEHGYAYQTAGITLSAAGRIDESTRILMKGIERGPNWWSYPFYVSFNYFFYLNDYETAAHWAEQAARRPGASTNISHLALSLKAKAHQPDDAILLLEELRSRTSDEVTARALDEQYKLAVLQRDFAALDAAVGRFRELNGHAPERVADLVTAGLLASVPEEPFGGEYYLERDGSVHSSGRDFRFKPVGFKPWTPPDFSSPRRTATAP